MYKFIIIILLLSSCTRVSDITKSLLELKDLEFEIQNTENYNLAGVDIKKFSSVKDMNIIDGTKILQGFTNKNLELTFRINLQATNPNTPKGKKLSARATISKLSYSILLEGKRTVSGSIEDKFIVPDGGGSVIIPINAKINLMQFFGGSSYKELINLVLSVGGAKKSGKKVELIINPTIESPIGDLSPGNIKVLEKEY